jgi:hypothetical protein
VAKALEISEQTLHRWRAQYGGLKADDAKRLKGLERDNTRLKRIVADKETRDRHVEGDRPGETSNPGAPPAGRRGPDRTLRGLRAQGLARWWANIAPPSATAAVRRLPTTRRSESVCGRSPRTGPAGGWRKAHDILRDEGWAINRKRTQRVWLPSSPPPGGLLS